MNGLCFSKDFDLIFEFFNNEKDRLLFPPVSEIFELSLFSLFFSFISEILECPVINFENVSIERIESKFPGIPIADI